MLSRCQEWLTNQRNKCKVFGWGRCTHAEKASTEFAGDIFLSGDMPFEERRQSLPRRLLGNFLSERNINDESEQLFLKQLLKDHGLYNKHQTMEQRRRLKQLLELERRILFNGDAVRGDESLVLHSLQSAHNETAGRSYAVEIHACHVNTRLTPELMKASLPPLDVPNRHTTKEEPRRRAKSFSMIPIPGVGCQLEATAFSQPMNSQEGDETSKPKCTKTISWEASPSYLETSV